MVDRSLEIQKQIVDNSKTISSYFQDLYEWEKDIAKKDNKLKDINLSVNKTSVDEVKINNIKQKEDVESLKETEKDTNISNKNHKLKRDTNSIKDYYDHWNKINLDNELEFKDKDENDISHNSKIELPSNKQSKAEINTKINLTRADINKNFIEYVERLKNEANANFQISNYNKSIELNSAALKVLKQNNIKSDDPLYINITNNKGNCYLKQKLYNEAIKEFDVIILNNNSKQNLKAVFRRGLCYFNIGKLNLAIEDLIIAHENSKDQEKEAIKIILDKCLSSLNAKIEEEKLKMEKVSDFDDSKAKRIKIKELIISNNELQNKENKESSISNKQNEFDKENNIKNQNKINKEQFKQILKKDEVINFIYDLTKERLTSSSFKYALRSFKDNNLEKSEFILVNKKLYYFYKYTRKLILNTYLQFSKMI